MATGDGATDHSMTRDLPSGLVTFVFTDIEASTRLYKVHGNETAGDVFDLHNLHLRAAWDSFNGHEVHTEGDSFFVVFEDPNDAINACLDVQERLAAADWPDGAEVRVRIGVHCGLAAPRNNDYMALAVHQAARVMSAANGGQILVTDAMLQRLDPLHNATVTRCGRYRLRDFDDAPSLYRIDSSLLTHNDRPPRATPANHHNLVPRLTSFVGRDRDVAAVINLLAPATAITLAGLGGMGKTRLAIEVGLQVAPSWEAGVWMVELAEVVDPELIAEEVAASIGVATTGVGDRWDDVIEFVGDKMMLLILDNVEHLIDEVAELIPKLLVACPNSAVLATSREPLNCQGEVIYRLGPLDVTAPPQDQSFIASVELFTDRARAVVADYSCHVDELDEVLEICRHLDGLPLAIEIAAAQVGVLQLTEIRTGLNNRFRLLRSRDRALPERQRTMEGLLGWSYQLLSESEQRAFRRLSVFGGSFSIDAAEAALAGNGIDADDVPELIWALVDKSLIAADLSDSATRYRLLESVQQYAMRLLIDNDDPVRSAVQLSEWLLERVAPWRPNDRTWLGDVAIELANIRNVMSFIADAAPVTAQQLMCSVGRYRDTTQAYHAGVDELSRAIAALVARTPARVALLTELADLHLRMVNFEAAKQLLDEADSLQREVGAPHWNEVAVVRSRGVLATQTGDFDQAKELARHALQQDISPRAAARMWSLAGIAESSLGALEAGLDALERSLDIYIELNDAAAIAIAHSNVAEAAWRLGDQQKAARHQRACLDDGLAIGQQVAIANSLIMAARLAHDRGDWRSAVTMRLWAQAKLGEHGHQLYEDEQLALDQAWAEVSREHGSADLAELVERTSALTAIEAAALAFDTFQLTSRQQPPTRKVSHATTTR